MQSPPGRELERFKACRHPLLETSKQVPVCQLVGIALLADESSRPVMGRPSAGPDIHSHGFKQLDATPSHLRFNPITSAKAARKRKGGTFVPAGLDRRPIDAVVDAAHNHCGFENCTAAGKRSPPMSAGPLDGNLEFLLLQHPMP